LPSALAQIQRYPNRQWVNDYLDLAREIIWGFGIAQYEPRFAAWMPGCGTLPWQ